MAWVTPALELQNHIVFAELINICTTIMYVWCLPPRKVDVQTLPECFGIGMVEKNVWGMQNSNGALQNVVSDSFLIYSALKTQHLEKPMEQSDCKADTKCFSKVLTRISKFQLVWKFYWNKWKTKFLKSHAWNRQGGSRSSANSCNIAPCFTIFVSGV